MVSSSPQDVVRTEYDGTEFEFPVDTVIECEHCEYVWMTQSESRRPTCPDCTRKTDRNVVSQQYMLYTKFFAGVHDAESLEELAELFEGAAKWTRALEDAGFEMDQIDGDGHYHLRREE